MRSSRRRFDDSCMFEALTKRGLTHIGCLQLGELGKRGAVRRITIGVTDEAKTWLADKGYDPAYGARPLRRLSQTAIGDRLARLLIAGTVTDGGQVTISVAEDGDDLVLQTS